jgi:cation:H+ antiporter
VLTELLDACGLNEAPAYLFVFVGVSLLMMWRLEAMLDHGLEGTALGTLIMPYCSGLGNLVFIGLMVAHKGAPGEVMTNCLVNNVTNLTLLLGLPALWWGLDVLPGKAKNAPTRKREGGAEAGTAGQLNRLSLLLTLAAALFFTGAVWVLGDDGRLDASDGLMLIGLFLFWQCIQVFDVMKHNVRQRISYSPMFYVDLAVVLACAWAIYESLDWLLAWIGAQKSGFISAANLGWLSGWLMVLPNAVLALYWGWRRRADIVYSSQVGDGHICIPLCLGLYALFQPLPTTGFFMTGLGLLLGTIVAHAILLIVPGGLPRWAGGTLVAAYAWFLWQGLG